jgi:hypothetical protein
LTPALDFDGLLSLKQLGEKRSYFWEFGIETMGAEVCPAVATAPQGSEAT